MARKLDALDQDYTDADLAGEDQHADCGCAALGLPLLEQSVNDGLEALAITLLRYFLVGVCSDRASVWDHAYGVSETAVGPVNGPLLVARMFALARALREERQVDFRFMPINCRYISEDEQELLAVIQAARSGDEPLTEGFAAMLARAPDTPKLLLTGQLVGRLLNSLAFLYQPQHEYDPAAAEPSITRH